MRSLEKNDMDNYQVRLPGVDETVTEIQDIVLLFSYFATEIFIGK